jgi:hypothetical protein
MKKSFILICLMLFLPTFAWAADECCFQGPGKCVEINFAHEKEICNRAPGNVVLDSACKDAPECQLSEEPPASPKTINGSQSGKETTGKTY